jgi:hypothetical protein
VRVKRESGVCTGSLLRLIHSAAAANFRGGGVFRFAILKFHVEFDRSPASLPSSPRHRAAGGDLIRTHTEIGKDARREIGGLFIW